MLNLNQLRAFYHTAKCLSFSGAAHELHVSQPAVTAQVKLFEEHCGLRLFIRRGRYLHLTEEGRTIYQNARKLFDYERKIEDAVEEIMCLEGGALRLGTARTYARYFMPHLIRAFHQRHPRLDIHLDEGSSLEVLHNLVELKNQMVITARRADVPNVHYLTICREEVVPVLSPQHRLARGKKISIAELADEPVILKEQGSGTRELVDEFYVRSHIKPKVVMETSDAEMIKLLVQYGEGLSFLVREAVSAELARGKLATAALEGGPLLLDVCAAHLDDAALSPAARAFLGLLKELSGRDGARRGLGALLEKLRALVPGEDDPGDI
ncbi:MAG: LysR family transcriptional regulator [Thermodesulfobacteriota bacterium]